MSVSGGSLSATLYFKKPTKRPEPPLFPNPTEDEPFILGGIAKTRELWRQFTAKPEVRWTLTKVLGHCGVLFMQNCRRINQWISHKWCTSQWFWHHQVHTIPYIYHNEMWQRSYKCSGFHIYTIYFWHEVLKDALEIARARHNSFFG